MKQIIMEFARLFNTKAKLAHHDKVIRARIDAIRAIEFKVIESKGMYKANPHVATDSFMVGNDIGSFMSHGEFAEMLELKGIVTINHKIGDQSQWIVYRPNRLILDIDLNQKSFEILRSQKEYLARCGDYGLNRFTQINPKNVAS
jgi:hypothetical protein